MLTYTRICSVRSNNAIRRANSSRLHSLARSPPVRPSVGRLCSPPSNILDIGQRQSPACLEGQINIIGELSPACWTRWTAVRRRTYVIDARETSPPTTGFLPRWKLSIMRKLFYNTTSQSNVHYRRFDVQSEVSIRTDFRFLMSVSKLSHAWLSW